MFNRIFLFLQIQYLAKFYSLKTIFCLESASSGFLLVEFSQLKLLENLCGGEDAAVDDPSDCEGAADDGAHGRHEVVEGRPVLVVADRDRVQVVPAGRGLGQARLRTKRG